ncbi:MAG: hydantoinase B/oxoprolinase family protein [Blastocatellia bacterium]|nr:hydantoinase B/oxoprolinase family protein [Blastocatellia bacterium]
MASMFQVGGTGGRAIKDGLSTTGFPSGVAGVPAEVIETLAPLVQSRRELRMDSGGAGKHRGGLGQATEIGYRGSGLWSVSAIIDRTQFAAQGIEGGQPGALGEFMADDDKHLQPKTVIWFEPQTRVQLNLPGGGGYGDPFARDPERVRDDVVNGYVSLAAAERDYGVAVRYTGDATSLVRPPQSYGIDWPATEQLRAAR